MLNKILKAIKNPKLLLLYILRLRIFRLLSDKKYIKIKYRLTTGIKLNLENPQFFNEKMQWLKLYDRNPQYTDFVDKHAVRKYISQMIGDKYLIPLYDVYDNYSDIKIDKLPNQFVMKPNHTSGDVYVCKDKTQINKKKLKKKVNLWMKRNYYWEHRESPYKNIVPKIIVEKYIVDESNTELKDYKVFCFQGKAKIIQVMSARNGRNYYVDTFDIHWNKLKHQRKNHEQNPLGIIKPETLEKMIEFSEKISSDMIFARIDWYDTPNGLLFGEITLYPASGYMDFSRTEDNLLLGSYINLSIKDKEKQ